MLAETSTNSTRIGPPRWIDGGSRSIRPRWVRSMHAALVAAAESHRPVGPLHAERPTRFRSLYADIQDNLSVLRAVTGQPEEAERPSRETLAPRRTLAAARPDAYRSQLAGTLFNLGLILSSNGRKQVEMRQLRDESLSIYDALFVRQPGRFDEPRDRVRACLDRWKADHDE